MAYSDIATEARILSVLSSDVDNYRDKYKTFEEELDGNKLNITFVSPKLEIYDKYRFYILQNCEKKKLELKHRYRPDYVSYEEYGTTNWWTLILYINDIPSIEEFNKEKILVPSIDCVTTLSNIEKHDVEVKDLHENDNISKPISFLYCLPNNVVSDTVKELSSVTSVVSNIDSDKFKREQHILDIPILRLRYIELEYEAVPTSINLVVKGKPNYVYGKHYVLTRGSSGKMTRITWDPNIVSGSGLVFRLKENDIIQVNYVTK